MNPFGPSASPKPLWGRKLGIFDHLAAHPLLPIVALLVFFGCAVPAPSWGAASGRGRRCSPRFPRVRLSRTTANPTSGCQRSGQSSRQAETPPAASLRILFRKATGRFRGRASGGEGAFSIYRPVPTSPASGRKTANMAAGDLPAYPVVFNQRTKALGVLTRRLWLKLKEMRDTDGIAKEYGMALSFSNAAMQTSFYEVPEGIDLQTLRTRLQSDPRIMRVTLEVIDRIRQPR